MKHNVSADTARGLSEQASGSAKGVSSSPSRAFFLQNIRGRFGMMISQKEKELARTSDQQAIEKLQKSIDSQKEKLKKFEEALENIPPQFTLSELIYTRISKEQNKKTEREYSDYVRPRFLMFLADKFPADLKKLGICDHGIKRMKNGLDPADEDRAVYNMTVDHIIERSGSGDWGHDQELDESIHNGHRKTYKVNHFSNLILLPASIHDGIKNAINEVQELPNLKPGETSWAMMMITRGRTEAECYMYVPEDAAEQKKHVWKHQRRISNEIYQIGVMAGQLTSEARIFQEYEEARKAKSGKGQKNGVSGKFNAGEDAQRVFDRRIKPLVQELLDILDSVEERIEQNRERDPEGMAECERQLTGALQRPVFGPLRSQLRKVEDMTGKSVGKPLFIRRRDLLEDLTGGHPFDGKYQPRAANGNQPKKAPQQRKPDHKGGGFKK
jgi:molecular chaperone GrpE (heat shock protein)